MSDPKDPKSKHEAPTSLGQNVPPRVAGSATGAQTPPPISAQEPAGQSDAPTVLDSGLPGLRSTPQRVPTGTPAGSTPAGVLLEPGTIKKKT